jgi:transposase InsO family protein
MTMKAITEVFERYKGEYWHGSKKKRGDILNTVCDTTGLHRKAAIRKFNKLMSRYSKSAERRGRPITYGADVQAALMSVWEVGAYCCAELLRTELDVYIHALQSINEWHHSDRATDLLLALSLGEMKRRISKLRIKHRIKGRSTTTPSTIKKKVRVYAGPWRNRPPGHRQFDSVVHCDDILKGNLVYTVNGVDTALLWSNRRAQLNKGEVATMDSVEYIESQIPSTTLSRHSDSGSEFLNFYFMDRSERQRITQTRSRSGKKNDNAFVEERNGNIVRKWIGYDRYDTKDEVDALNAVYEKLDLYLNHFQAVRRCIKRERVGARYVRVYDKPRTPYARAMEHADVSKDAKQRLLAVHSSLNPVTLLREIAKMKSLLASVNHATKLKK